MAWTLCDDGQGDREGLFTGSAAIWGAHVTLRLCRDGGQVPRRPWSSSPFCLVPRPGAHATVTSLRCPDVPFKRPFPGLPSRPYFSTQTSECVVCEHQGRGDDEGLGDSEPSIGVPGGGPAGLSCIPSRDEASPQRGLRASPHAHRRRSLRVLCASEHRSRALGQLLAESGCSVRRKSPKREMTLIPERARAPLTPGRPVPR